MQKFVSFYKLESDEIGAMSEEEFREAKADPDFLANHTWDEWVWQLAESKEQAIAQHFDKLDAWELDPTKEVY